MAHLPPLMYNKSEIDKNEFKRLYELLDNIDLPLSDHGIRTVRPISWNGGMGNENEAIHADVNDITLRDSTHLQLRKRALSYFHGAMLAIQSRIQDNNAKAQAQLNIIRLYNDHERARIFYRVDLLKHFGKSLTKALEPYGITDEDIQAGEKLANLERERPNQIRSQTPYGLITEMPLPAHMEHEALIHEYDFILNGSTGLRSQIYSSYSLANREAYSWYSHKWWITQKLLNVTAQMGMAFAKWGLSTAPIFLWFIRTAEKVEQAHTAENALTTANAPKWFAKHNRVVQDYLLQHAGDERLPSIPPTLRNIPGLPNMSVHISSFGENDHAITNQVMRHGTLTPYDMVANPAERRTAALSNGKALASIIDQKSRANFEAFWTREARMSSNFKHFKIPTADLSFMSPYPGMGKVGAIKKTASRHRDEMSIFDERISWFREDNHAMKRENKEAYLVGMSEKENLHPSSINLGINGDRWLISKTFQSEQYQDQVKATLSDFERLQMNVAALKAAGVNPFVNQISENKFEFAILAAEALKKMNEEFNQSYFSSSFTRSKTRSKLINAELFASCLYAIVIQGMGGTVSACCKSSKDRTGLFLLHLDAMYAYFAKTGELIDYKAPVGSVSRREFIDILSDLYIANPQQSMASQTTLGAAGIKEPKGLGTYIGSAMSPLPADMEPAVNRKVPVMFEQQRQLADTNKLKI